MGSSVCSSGWEGSHILAALLSTNKTIEMRGQKASGTHQLVLFIECQVTMFYSVCVVLKQKNIFDAFLNVDLETKLFVKVLSAV